MLLAALYGANLLKLSAPLDSSDATSEIDSAPESLQASPDAVETKALSGIMEAIQSGFSCVYQSVMQLMQNANQNVANPANEISPMAEMAGDAAQVATISMLDDLFPENVAHSAGETIAYDVSAIVDYLADNLNSYLVSESNQLADSMNYSIVQDNSSLTITFPSASHKTNPETVSVYENVEKNTIEVSNMIKINDEISMMICYSFARPSNVEVVASSAVVSVNEEGTVSVTMPLLNPTEPVQIPLPDAPAENASPEAEMAPEAEVAPEVKSHKRSHEVSSTVYSVNILRRY